MKQVVSMNKQWIYRNGEKPFSVTEIKAPEGYTQYVSMSGNNIMRTHGIDGYTFFGPSNHDLIPYEPYSDFKIDDKVNCWDDDNDELEWGHFAGLDNHGKPTTFHKGGTSFTRSSIQRYSWNFCEKAAPTEDK